MAATAKIQLDVNTLAVLFPEGSAARVELQQAVIAQFTRQFIKPALVGEEVKKIVDTAKAEAVKAALSAAGIGTGWSGSVTLPGKVIQAFRDEAESQITQAHSEAVKKACEALIVDENELVLRISRRVNRLLEEKSVESIRSELQRRLSAAVEGIRSA